MANTSPAQAWLIPLPSERPLDALPLNAAINGGSLVIGRNKECDLFLPNAESVSRRHSQLIQKSGRWHIADLGSRWGTQVNGVRLAPNQPVALSEGDLIRIQPWTFRFAQDRNATSGSVSIDDHATTMVRTHASASAEPLRQDMLSLLLEGASSIQSASDELQLMEVILKLARLGTGLQNATVLKALDANGRVETVTSSFSPGSSPNTGMQFSRSLLAAASQGTVAEFSSTNQTDYSQSILQAQITTAMCAPLMLGTAVAAYLYLDSRGGAGQPVRTPHPNAAGFCMALCRIGGLALANLKRIDIERRASRLEGELTAASAAQRWIMPRKPVAAGPIICSGQSQSGGFLGGDFFDALVLPDGRLAVALGDVSGHSAAASVLMTASQGFLHASLIAHGDLARAFNDLNSFVQARSSSETFVTLWAGIFDPHEMSLQYVDAGHGYAMLFKPDQTLQSLDENGGLPIGIDAGIHYEAATTKFAPRDRVLVFSDGIAEQSSQDVSSEGQREQFGKVRVQQLMMDCAPESLLADLFNSLRTFARGSNFADDVTGMLVHWSLAQ